MAGFLQCIADIWDHAQTRTTVTGQCGPAFPPKAMTIDANLILARDMIDAIAFAHRASLLVEKVNASALAKGAFNVVVLHLSLPLQSVSFQWLIARRLPVCFLRTPG